MNDLERKALDLATRRLLKTGSDMAKQIQEAYRLLQECNQLVYMVRHSNGLHEDPNE